MSVRGMHAEKGGHVLKQVSGQEKEGQVEGDLVVLEKRWYNNV